MACSSPDVDYFLGPVLAGVVLVALLLRYLYANRELIESAAKQLQELSQGSTMNGMGEPTRQPESQSAAESHSASGLEAHGTERQSTARGGQSNATAADKETSTRGSGWSGVFIKAKIVRRLLECFHTCDAIESYAHGCT